MKHVFWLVFLLAGPVWAQDGPIDLGTLVLRGELQERTFDDTQSSVTVITGEALEKRGDQDLYDAIERTPGVNATLGEKGFAIRGTSQRATGGTALAVSTQVDGVALPDNDATVFGPYPTWDVDQFEVFRGPQSTLQGRNALAGAIVIRTRDPEFEQAAALRAELGSREFYRFAFMANTQLVEDRLAFRIAGSTQRDSGFVFNTTLGIDYDPRHFEDLRLKLRWTPTDRFEAILSYSVTERGGGENFITGRFFPALRVNEADQVSTERSRHEIVGLRLKYALSEDHVFENELSFYTHNYFRQEDFDFTAQPLGFLTADGGSQVIENNFRYRFEGTGFRGTLGVFLSEIEGFTPFTLNTDIGFLTGVATGIVPSRLDLSRSSVRNYAVFGEVEIDADHWAPGLTFTLGARYEIEEFSLDQTVVTTVPGLPPVQDVRAPIDSSYEAFLPKIGLSFDFNERQSIGLTYQRGYRAGSAVQNLFTGVVNDVDPETTDNVELAYRGHFFDDAL